MKYIFIGSVTLIITLLVSKLFMALNIVHNNNFTVVHHTKNKVQNKPLSDLEQTGQSSYIVHCSSCHGYDGKGNNGKAQDHTKRIAEKSVLDVIQNGANNFKSLYPSGMPVGLVNEKDAKALAKYVANGLQGDKPSAWKVCASCHDESGEGIAFIAPNIKNYSDELVTTVLTNGKKGVIGTMPNFKEKLSTRQMKALAAYIRSLGKV